MASLSQCSANEIGHPGAASSRGNPFSAPNDPCGTQASGLCLSCQSIQLPAPLPPPGAGFGAGSVLQAGAERGGSDSICGAAGTELQGYCLLIDCF